MSAKDVVSGPRVIPSREWPGRVAERVHCVVWGDKIDRCRAPECSEPEVAGSGHLDGTASASYGKKRRNYSMFQELVRMLPSESFSL